jgi:serine/threonine protein kinase
LKPDNILYTSSDRAQIKITDWGLGRDIGRKSIALTASLGQIGGTPGYCAPEQWFTFDMVDGRADIYSLGVIFYEMMTGRMPSMYDQRDSSLKRSKVVDLPSKYFIFLKVVLWFAIYIHLQSFSMRSLLSYT